MRPFFSYYGAKYTAAKHLGKPRREIVVEPFAGSACYSTRWNARNVKLYDVSSDICSLWEFLISCSENDIAAIPDKFESMEEVDALPQGARLLVQFWISKGRAEPSGTLSPWYFQWRNTVDCRVWGPAVKRRVISQKPLISEWTIDQLSWDRVPLVEAHWHIDPPYNNAPGSRYPHSDVDYEALATWCRHLPGAVDVCENVGAGWLPFKPLCDVVTSRGRRSGATSKEAVWRRHPMTDRYGDVSFPDLKAAYDALRAACREEGTPRIQAALDRYEPWADYVYQEKSDE